MVLEIPGAIFPSTMESDQGIIPLTPEQQAKYKEVAVLNMAGYDLPLTLRNLLLPQHKRVAKNAVWICSKCNIAFPHKRG